MPLPARLGFLDVIRGVAILSVFLFHAVGISFGPYQLPWKGLWRDFKVPEGFRLLLPVTFGYLGVAVFFVVSGFCIHLSHVRSGESGFKIFFARRFFRIYPPYVLCLLAFTFLAPWPVGLSSPGGKAQVLSHLALVHNFDHRFYFGINGSFWSIAVEAQLYLLYPVLWHFARRFGWPSALALSAVVEFSLRAATACVSLVTPEELVPLWLNSSPFSYWFSWCLGAACADAWLTGRAVPVRARSLVAVAAALLAAYFLRPTAEFVFPMAATITAGVIMLPQRRDGEMAPGGARAISRSLAGVGVCSYSLYLLHQPILGWIPVLLAQILQVPPAPLISLGCCIAAFFPIWGLSWVLYKLVELPGIAAGKWAIRKVAG